MKIIIPIILFLLFTGCDQGQNTQGQQETKQDTTALYTPLNYPNQEVALLPATKEITEDWLAFLTAQAEIENFGTYTVKDVSSNAGPIVEIMHNLRETAPKNLKTHAVQTRLSVLYTKAKVLEFLASKRDPDYASLKLAAEEIPLEFNNFKIQLNELFLKTLEELEEELDAYNAEDTTSLPLLRIIPERYSQN